MRIAALPKNPDDDCQFYSFGGQRLAFLDTTPEAHANGVPLYKVAIHSPGATFPSNGLPIVPPTPELVRGCLAAALLAPDSILGVEPVRGLVITAEADSAPPRRLVAA